MAILQVLSNLNHNGTLYKAGMFFEGELETFGHLVEDGVLRIVDGAKNIEDAEKIVAKQAEAIVKAQVSSEPAVEPKNTFEGKSDEQVAKEKADAEAEAKTAGFVKFKVLVELDITDKNSTNFGKHEVGSFLSADPIAAQALVDNGTLELVVAPVEAKKEEAGTDLPPAGDNL